MRQILLWCKVAPFHKAMELCQFEQLRIQSALFESYLGIFMLLIIYITFV